LSIGILEFPRKSVTVQPSGFTVTDFAAGAKSWAELLPEINFNNIANAGRIKQAVKHDF